MQPHMQQAFLELRIFLQDHFIAVEERFCRIEEKLQDIDAQEWSRSQNESETFGTHIETTRSAEDMETHFERIDRRFDGLELSLFDLAGEIKIIQEKVFSHELHLEKLTTVVNTFIALHHTIDLEFSTQRSKNERVDHRIKQLEKVVM